MIVFLIGFVSFQLCGISPILIAEMVAEAFDYAVLLEPITQTGIVHHQVYAHAASAGHLNVVLA